MGNCYGEDGDSEDEYYGYYGKNNRLKPKPQPSPTPPNPTLTLSEPNPHEFDHDDLNPPMLSKPDYHNTEYANTDREDDANDADWEDDREHETESVGAPEYENNGEYRHGERESEAETEEYEDGVLAGGEYEHEELKCEGGETYEHKELVYSPEHGDAEQGYEHGIDERKRLETGNNEVYELRELEHEPQEQYELQYEPKHSDSDAHYGIHEPRTLESSGVPQCAEPKYEGPGRRMHPTPTTPNPSIARLRPPPWPDPNTHHL
jgi:hypothetical protein